MNITFRWFGNSYDSVSLEKIRQLPHITGIVSTLYGKQPGEIWTREEIKELKDTIESAGFSLLGIESVNIHESIKAGLPERNQYIDNYIATLTALGEEGIPLVCYNFMPVFDWIRSSLASKRPDGATVLSYDDALIQELEPEKLFDHMYAQSNGFLLAGWEPERLSQVKKLLSYYQNCTDETLFANLEYFLKAVIPVCEHYGIKLALHPDDPPWSVFGIPRIVNKLPNLQRIINMVPSSCNGITLCTGSLAANTDNNVVEIIHALQNNIYFVHIRNIRLNGIRKFEETSHLSCDGDMDMYAIMNALHSIGFNGILRPDHGRAIWGEVAIPGYGLFDQALGSAYIYGLWEALEKTNKTRR